MSGLGVDAVYQFNLPQICFQELLIKRLLHEAIEALLSEVAELVFGQSSVGHNEVLLPPLLGVGVKYLPDLAGSLNSVHAFRHVDVHHNELVRIQALAYPLLAF